MMKLIKSVESCINESKQRNEKSVIWIPPLPADVQDLNNVVHELRTHGYIVHATYRGVKIRWEDNKNVKDLFEH